jgi:pyruvate dehydrogenase E2 component (dihydrolipoamide acetyltransferase)
VARELGVDWTELRGTGRTGRIRECDVQAAFKRHQVTAPALAAQPTGRHIPLSSIRKTIAHRTRASLQTTAAVTLTTEADATNLVNLRGQFQSAAATKPGAGAKPLVPTYTDLIVKLTAAALQQHPMLMAQWTDEGLFLPDGIHIGIAVDTEAGLVAPVVREVPALTLRQLAAESRTLIELAHTRRLPADKLSGGTFTVTNLGMYGIDAFTPIIDPPQSSILGIGRIRREPAVVDDRIVPRERMTLSLTFDHRTIDGAPAARFLNTVRLYVENPGPRLMA